MSKPAQKIETKKEKHKEHGGKEVGKSLIALHHALPYLKAAHSYAVKSHDPQAHELGEIHKATKKHARRLYNHLMKK